MQRKTDRLTDWPELNELAYRSLLPLKETKKPLVRRHVHNFKIE